MSDYESQSPQNESWDSMLIQYGAVPDRLPKIKDVLAGVGITRNNLQDLIKLSESRMGFGGNGAELNQVAADLQDEKVMFRSHYEDHD